MYIESHLRISFSALNIWWESIVIYFFAMIIGIMTDSRAKQGVADDLDDNLMADYKLNHYGYTINISPGRMIRGTGRRFDGLSHDEQKALLIGLVSGAILTSRIDAVYADASYFNFELTEKDNYHLHGSFVADTPSAHAFQQYVHLKYGTRTIKPERICYITATEVNHVTWIDYRRKKELDQDGEPICAKNLFI